MFKGAAAVSRYNASFVFLDSKSTSDGVASWPNVPTGTYNLEAYSNGEFWGAAQTSVSQNNTANVTIQRNEPYATAFVTKLGSTEVTGSTVPAESNLSHYVTVINSTAGSQKVRVLLRVDRSKSSAYDFEDTSIEKTISSGGTKTFSFPHTPTTAGTYYRYLEVQTSVSGNWVKTDTYDWGEPLTVVSVEPLTVVSVEPPDEPSGPSPVDGAVLSSQPLKLNWANTTGAESYDVFLKLSSGAFTKVGSDLTVSEWSPNQSYDPTSFSWYVIAKNAGGTTKGPTWSFSIPDITPDGFRFAEVIGAEVNGTYTYPITVSGINAATAISIVGDSDSYSYRVNGGAYTSAAGTVNNGNTVTVRQTSSTSYSKKTSATLTIGGVSDSYDVTTKAAESTVNACDRQNLAIGIRNNGSRIELAPKHTDPPSNNDDLNSSAERNILDAADGKRALTSEYGHSRGALVWLDPRMLNGMNRLAQAYSFSVSEVAGGGHLEETSKHYVGLAFDVNVINGTKVNPNHPDKDEFINLCFSMGARRAKLENDNHIHVDWTYIEGNVACGGGGASSPTITEPKLAGTTFTLSTSTESDHNYILEYKNSMSDATWTYVKTASGNGGQITLSNTETANPSRFYRVRVE